MTLTTLIFQASLVNFNWNTERISTEGYTNLKDLNEIIKTKGMKTSRFYSPGKPVNEYGGPFYEFGEFFEV